MGINGCSLLFLMSLSFDDSVSFSGENCELSSLPFCGAIPIFTRVAAAKQIFSEPSLLSNYDVTVCLHLRFNFEKKLRIDHFF